MNNGKRSITLGLDIGYSGVKWVHAKSHGGHTTSNIFPARAAPVATISEALIGGDSSGIEVVVDDEKWVAGVDPSAIPNNARELDQNYIQSKVYKALFHAALKDTNQSEITTLVTGLPVSLYKSQGAQLKEMMQGAHQIDATGRTVKVAEVTVVPQPLGGFFELTMSGKFGVTDLAMSKVLVLDPGWFSFDWVVIDQNRLQGSLSGMSTEAMSRVCEYTAELITDAEEFPVPAVKVETCLPQDKREIAIRGKRFEISEHLQKAAEKAWENVRREIGQTLRSDRLPPDIVVVCGGGAQFFEAPIRSHFTQPQVYISTNSIVANATGFQYYAKRTPQSATSKKAVNA